MDWVELIFGLLFLTGGCVLYYLEYEVCSGMPEFAHWWKTVCDNHFIGTGLMYWGTWELFDILVNPWLFSDDTPAWMGFQAVMGMLVAPIVLELFIGIIKTRIKK